MALRNELAKPFGGRDYEDLYRAALATLRRMYPGSPHVDDAATEGLLDVMETWSGYATSFAYDDDTNFSHALTRCVNAAKEYLRAGSLDRARYVPTEDVEDEACSTAGAGESDDQDEDFIALKERMSALTEPQRAQVYRAVTAGTEPMPREKGQRVYASDFKAYAAALLAPVLEAEAN